MVITGLFITIVIQSYHWSQFLKVLENSSSPSVPAKGRANCVIFERILGLKTWHRFPVGILGKVNELLFTGKFRGKSHGKSHI